MSARVSRQHLPVPEYGLNTNPDLRQTKFNKDIQGGRKVGHGRCVGFMVSTRLLKPALEPASRIAREAGEGLIPTSMARFLVML